MRFVATAIVLFGLNAAPVGAWAADLDNPPPAAYPAPYPAAGAPVTAYDERLAEGSVPVPPPVPPVLDQVLTPRGPTPAVGGPFVVIPGLNGPSGPPVYPLLPFAFGYGY